VRTCWKALPVMRSVADALERRHAGAVEVRLARRDGARRIVPAAAGSHVTSGGDDVSDDRLVFCTISPDYCLPDKSAGSAGTRHRFTSD